MEGFLVLAVIVVVVLVVKTRRTERAQQQAQRQADERLRADHARRHADRTHRHADEARRTNELRRTRTLHDLLELTPVDFERHVGELLMSHGYRHLRTTAATGDRGIDLEGQDAEGRSVVVQCKRYSPGTPIGGAAVRDLAGTMRLHGADRGIFVTTSRYTRDAIDTARRCNIELVDGEGLTRLHTKTFGESAAGAGGASDTFKAGIARSWHVAPEVPRSSPDTTPEPAAPRVLPSTVAKTALSGTATPSRTVSVRRAVHLPNGQAAEAAFDVQGSGIVEDFHVVRDPFDEDDTTTHSLVLELRNSSQVAQNYTAKILLRARDQKAVGYANIYFYNVAPQARDIEAVSCDLTRSVRQFDVVVTSSDAR